MKKLGAIFLLALPCLLLCGLRVSADAASTWFTSNPAVRVVPISGEPLGKIDTYNIPCTSSTFNHYGVGSWNAENSGEVTACMHAAGYGEISRDSGVLLKSTKTAYQIRPSDGSIYEQFRPVVGTDHIFTTSGGTGNNREFFYIYKNFPERFTVYKNPNTGKIQYYRLNSSPFDPENRVKFPNGEFVSINPLTLSYAASGKFMAGNYGSYQVVINTETLLARKFGFNTPNYTGAYPKVNTALNHSGSLALVNVSDGPGSMLYDLDECTGAAEGSVVQSCKSLDMFATIKSKLPNLKSIARTQFISDNTVYFQARLSTSQGITTQWYKAQLPQGDAVDYLALGDSFASGEGAYNYKPGTDQQGNKCHTSLDSYAYLIKSQMSFTNAESIACSGAVQKDIRIVGESVYSLNDPQAKGKDGSQYDSEVFSGYMPGYRRQVAFIEKYQPRTATLSIGGNDIGFAGKLTWCVLSPQSCYMFHSERAGLLKEIKAQFPELVKTYTALKNASPETKIYVLGYPNIAKPDGKCAYNVRLTNEEIELAEAIVVDLNYVIQKAAEKAGVFYVDASDAFRGHRMCETPTASTAVNGLTLGNDMATAFGYSLLGKESYHPNKLGHQLYKNTILAKTNSLSEPMPGVDDGADIKNMPSRLATDASTLSVPLPLRFMSEKESIIKRGANLILDTAVNTWLEPGTNYRVEIHSKPQEIGTAFAKDTNTLSVNARIPTDIGLGPHTLHILGQNIVGESIDVYKEIIIIGTDEDYDGDHINNTKDNCPFMEFSVSVDHDTPGAICSIKSTDLENTVHTEGENERPISYTPKLSAPSSGNSLTSWLGAPPGQNFFGAASLGLTQEDHKESKQNLQINSSTHPNLRPRSSFRKYFILVGLGSPFGAVLLLRLRRVR